LEQLLALNEEIAALVRAGVPLERGLSLLGRDLPGRLGKIAVQIGAELERGRSLCDALEAAGEAVPATYRAVVAAGVKSGRLAAALEAMASAAQRIAEMRQIIAGALLYPLLVFLLVWGLLAVFMAEILPRVTPVFEDLHAPGAGLLRRMEGLGQWAGFWGPAVPAVVLSVAGFWWYQTARASLAEPRLAARLLAWLPVIRGVLRLVHSATFAEVLALLVENRVPLAEALSLAADASGDVRTARAARQMASAVQKGQNLAEGTQPVNLPPLVRWMIVAGYQRGMLASALRRAADMYRRQAVHRAETARLFIPVLLTLALAGTMTLLYVVLLLGPWIGLLRSIAGW